MKRTSLVTLLVLAALPTGAITLENKEARVSVDERGNLTALTNLRSGHNYASGKPLWRMFYRVGDSFENEIVSEDSQAAVSRVGEAIVLRYSKVQSRRGPLDVKLELQARLVGDEVRWSARVENHEPGITITELEFPLVAACNIKPGQELIWSNMGGERFKDPRARIRSARTLYMAPDQHGIKMTTLYPGGGAATNCFAFAGKDEGLYFGSHDPAFQHTLHLFRLQGEDIETGFAKYPFLNTGKTYAVDGYVISPYGGDWHVAAKKYRAWANTWFKAVSKPAWVENMAGWQRVILKHQYGEVLHPYSEMPGVYADGVAGGIRTLLAFGWHDAGMDAGYPNYVADERQGGRAALAGAIRKIHAEGGKVHLYFNGRLIDKESAFYRQGGGSIAIKDWRGNELTEAYHFSGDGTAVRQFGRKSFVMACPSSAKWRDMMMQWADLAIGLGADSVFYDQVGYGEYPCTDPSHGHPVPFTTVQTVKADVLRQIREHIKARGSDLALGTEWLNDMTSQYADFLHNVTGASGTSSDWRHGVKPEITGFVEWFRYTFPEMIVSDREIRDDTDVERRVNHALLLGLRSDVEIYRCRGTLRDTPNYSAYLAKANAVRAKYADFLLKGAYRDTEGFEISNNEIEARSFQSGDRLAVVLTQSHLDEAATELAVPGYHLVESGGLGEPTVKAFPGGPRVTLKRHALAVVVFTKG